MALANNLPEIILLAGYIAWILKMMIFGWLLIGDFNFYRSAENRNRPGDNFNDSFIFNNIISHLGLIELPIKGQSYTWSNMQGTSLLEQVDWFFTSVAWTNQYPLTVVLPLARITSDHLPYKIQIDTSIPKANIFRFENYWFSHPCCIDQICGRKFLKSIFSVTQKQMILPFGIWPAQGEGFIPSSG